MHVHPEKMDTKSNLAPNSIDCSHSTDFGGENQLLRNQFSFLSKGELSSTTRKNSVILEEITNKEPTDQATLPSICIETPDRFGKTSVLSTESPASQTSWSPSLSDTSPQDKLKSLEDFQHFSLGVSVSNNKYFSPLKKRYGIKAKEQADFLHCKKLEKSIIENKTASNKKEQNFEISLGKSCTKNNMPEIEIDLSQDDSDASSTSVSSTNTPIKKRGKMLSTPKSNLSTKRQLFLEEDDEDMEDPEQVSQPNTQTSQSREEIVSKYGKQNTKGNIFEAETKHSHPSPTVVDPDTSSEAEDVVGSEEEEGDYEDEEDEEIGSPSKRKKSHNGQPTATKLNTRLEKKRKVKPIIKKSPNNGKVYDSVKGTTCHQCKQKTMDRKTVCSRCSHNNNNSTIRGCYCGSCLLNRYGEDIDVVLQNSNWICPICRDCCNCSSCRRRMGKNPVSITTREALKKGYGSVFQMLQKEKDKYQ